MLAPGAVATSQPSQLPATALLGKIEKMIEEVDKAVSLVPTKPSKSRHFQDGDGAVDFEAGFSPSDPDTGQSLCCCFGPGVLRHDVQQGLLLRADSLHRKRQRLRPDIRNLQRFHRRSDSASPLSMVLEPCTVHSPRQGSGFFKRATVSSARTTVSTLNRGHAHFPGA